MSTVEEIRAGVDWLSMTLGHEDTYNAEWRFKCIKHLTDLAGAGYHIHDRALLGYRGLSAGNNFVGSREDGHLVQWTGHHAQEAFDVSFHPRANIPRIDVQVTVRFLLMPPNLTKTYYEQAESAIDELPVGRKRKVWCISGSDGGGTVYIGSPNSLQRCRIYNKEVQSEDPAYTRCWRYEVTFKGQLAKVVYQGLPKYPLLRAQQCANIVHIWLTKRGLSLPWEEDETAGVLPIIKTLPSDVESTLWWLDKQVKPALRKLRDAGYQEQAFAALGITE